MRNHSFSILNGYFGALPKRIFRSSTGSHLAPLANNSYVWATTIAQYEESHNNSSLHFDFVVKGKLNVGRLSRFDGDGLGFAGLFAVHSQR